MTNKLLSTEEILDLSQSIPQWEVQEQKIIRSFDFKNFIEAFGFITKVAIISESMGHHPDWSNSYSKVLISLTTHDLGGISNLDLKLAKKVDQLVIE